MPKLQCKKVRYYSETDELVFFKWIESIRAVKRYYGEGDTLYLVVKSTKISKVDLRDLLGLFFRYKIEMTQLRQFLTESNQAWFKDNPRAYWHKRVWKSR